MTLIFRDGQQIWDVDWKTWGEVELARCPSRVAMVKLGLGVQRAHITPGEAVKTIAEAFEENGLFNRRVERLLDGIPKDYEGFQRYDGKRTTYPLVYWFDRWWEALAAAI